MTDAESGDPVIDTALSDLREVDPQDLDAVLETGQRVHDVVAGRLHGLDPSR